MLRFKIRTGSGGKLGVALMFVHHRPQVSRRLLHTVCNQAQAVTTDDVIGIECGYHGNTDRPCLQKRRREAFKTRSATKNARLSEEVRQLRNRKTPVDSYVRQGCGLFHKTNSIVTHSIRRPDDIEANVRAAPGAI